MGRKSEKAKDKKMKRKAEQAAEDSKIKEAQIACEAANSLENPMAELIAFKKFERNGLTIDITCSRMAGLDQATMEWAFQLTKDNMEKLYEECGENGWSDSGKREEMTEEAAWYLICRDQDGKPHAFIHFRFDVEEGEEVLYCYEIQLIKEARNKGLGKFLMAILELMAHKANMKKVMLTVFKTNDAAQQFFRKLKYTVDEISPEEDLLEALYDLESYKYQILSKAIKPKAAAKSKTKPLATQNTNAVTAH